MDKNTEEEIRQQKKGGQEMRGRSDEGMGTERI